MRTTLRGGGPPLLHALGQTFGPRIERLAFYWFAAKLEALVGRHGRGLRQSWQHVDLAFCDDQFQPQAGSIDRGLCGLKIGLSLGGALVAAILADYGYDSQLSAQSA